MKTCFTCKIEYPDTDFMRSDRVNLTRECISCRKKKNNITSARYYAENRDSILAYYEENKESICESRRARRPFVKSGTIEYMSYASMKTRCYGKNTKEYSRYGGRGITVCERWLESFDNFLSDMGNRPSPEHSIDRIDNDKGYSPENCKWSTKKEQGRNTRTVKLSEEKALIIRECWEYDSRAFTQRWLAKVFKVAPSTISKVVNKTTWGY